MTQNVFISYRRNDEPGSAQALFARLEAAFPADTLFMDVTGVSAGDDFEIMLREKIKSCDVLLAVIGPGWFGAAPGAGKRRLDDARDFVRIEIASALRLRKHVIPVLVRDMRMPEAAELPKDLQPLATRQAVQLRHDHYGADVAGLVQQVSDWFARRDADEQARAERARLAREEKAAEEAKRQAALENQRVLAERFGALTPEQIRKAEELANWDFIKESTRIEDFRDHLARFPGGVCEKMALAKLEPLVWESLGPTPGEPALTAYLAEFPGGAHAQQAQARIDALKPREEPKRTPPAPAPVPRPKSSSGIPGVIGLVLFMQIVGVAYHWYAYPNEPWYNGFGWPIRSIFQAAPSTPKFDFDTKGLGSSPNFGQGLKSPLFNQQVPANNLSR